MLHLVDFEEVPRDAQRARGVLRIIGPLVGLVTDSDSVKHDGTGHHRPAQHGVVQKRTIAARRSAG